MLRERRHLVAITAALTASERLRPPKRKTTVWHRPRIEVCARRPNLKVGEVIKKIEVELSGEFIIEVYSTSALREKI
ncbi:hypothetical protein AKJ48_02895 [candidate division MSBL1 archaeon SCGC-AAA261O19]|uniref:Uncharacterized protein n=1 Tax=candidate division MSBL1 archaeon SCGC-AAA261O19 TaxID=1698277 RepID=A0A133VD32_9EURY|nr:hypothetical protein AKJ48_02895 [candidate division MSBL1 archaeon SCGC-AAA261O19]